MQENIKRFASIEATEAALRAYVPVVKEITGKDITLQRMEPLMAALGNPQNKLKIVHIAGTSGKTSTAYYIAKMLQRQGRKVGLTVSPHIDSVTERVQINSSPISEWEFTDALGEFWDIIESVSPQPSYFELLAAFAYWYFEKVGVDIAVVETGFGGLHDGTNVANNSNKICAITDIGLDHTQILGESLDLIAAQKVGIVHPKNTLITYHQSEQIDEIFRGHAMAVSAEILFQNQADLFSRYTNSGLLELPAYQQRNWLLARMVCETVAKIHNLDLDDQSIQASLSVDIPGRMDTQTVDDQIIIMDGAHNEQKNNAFIDSFQQKFPDQKVPLLVSFKQDKEYLKILPLLRQISDEIIVTSFEALQDLPVKSQDVSTLAKAARESGFKSVIEIADSRAAYQKLLEISNGLAVITGSFYLIALARLYARQKVVRAIAAIDDNYGLADDHGIPWSLPLDRRYTKEKTMGGALLMGYNTYIEFESPLTGRRNLVLVDETQVLRDGFEPIRSVEEFFKEPPANLWLFGGAGAFRETLEYADELYLTRVKGDFDCTKFFPPFEKDFALASSSKSYTENGIRFQFEIWRRKH